MMQRVRIGALTVSTVLLTIGASASAEPNRIENHMPCDRNGTTIKDAPWTMAIQEKIGLRIVHGTRYFIWRGAAGPTCAFARRNVGRLVRAATPRALRLASFGGLRCRVDRLGPQLLGFDLGPLGLAAGPQWVFRQDATSPGSFRCAEHASGLSTLLR